MGPMWKNTQYTAAVPTGGTGLLGVRPAISEVANFCTDEMNAGRSLAPMKGEGVVYSPQWYDASGKPMDCLTASPPTNPDEPPSSPEDVPNEEVPLATPAPVNTAGNGPDDDMPSPRRRPVLNQNQILAVQVRVQVVGIPVQTRPAVVLEAGKMTPTATPRARPPRNIRSGGRGNLINPTETLTRKLFQR